VHRDPDHHEKQMSCCYSHTSHPSKNLIKIRRRVFFELSC